MGDISHSEGIMFYCMLIGFLIVGLVYWKDREVLRFDFEAVKNFIALMVLLTFFRLAIFSFGHDVLGINIADINQGFGRIDFWRLGLAFWEDAFFAIPIYYMKDKWKWSSYIWLPITAALSIHFGLGHMYQFEMAYFAALIIPYVFFYRYGKKYGFATTMICHILFDMFTLLTFKLSPFVVL